MLKEILSVAKYAFANAVDAYINRHITDYLHKQITEIKFPDSSEGFDLPNEVVINVFKHMGDHYTRYGELRFTHDADAGLYISSKYKNGTYAGGFWHLTESEMHQILYINTSLTRGIYKYVKVN